MRATDQSDVLAFLSTPAAFGEPPGEPVERMETHISVIFLCGDQVLKLKKARTLPYLDFATLPARKAAVEAEFAINSTTAPMIYQGIRTVTRQPDGALTMDGDGAPVEYLVSMARFDQGDLLDAVAARDGLTPPMMEALADAVAAFHAAAPTRPAAGGGAAMASIIENNALAFDLAPAGTFDPAQVAAVRDGSIALCDLFAPLLDARREQGRVRRCHGDMHLRNIVLMDGKPVLFDAIEFNEAFSDIDVFYDLGFLLMDLDHRGLKRLANVVLNRYVDVTGDSGGVALLSLVLAMRAAIRAHVGGTAIASAPDPVRARAQARAYLERAQAYLTVPEPRLIAVGGLSGSGKSRLARELAPFAGPGIGCRVVRTDATRKRLAGVGLLDRLPPDSYTPEMSEKTYAAVFEEAAALLAAGCPVIVDAVFAKPDEREAARALAVRAGVAFDGVWLEAPADVMRARAETRMNNVSDAGAAVVDRQLTYDLGAIDWARIDSSGAKSETLNAGLRVLGLETPSQI